MHYTSFMIAKRVFFLLKYLSDVCNKSPLLHPQTMLLQPDVLHATTLSSISVEYLRERTLAGRPTWLSFYFWGSFWCMNLLQCLNHCSYCKKIKIQHLWFCTPPPKKRGHANTKTHKALKQSRTLLENHEAFVFGDYLPAAVSAAGTFQERWQDKLQAINSQLLSRFGIYFYFLHKWGPRVQPASNWADSGDQLLTTYRHGHVPCCCTWMWFRKWKPEEAMSSTVWEGQEGLRTHSKSKVVVLADEAPLWLVTSV